LLEIKQQFPPDKVVILSINVINQAGQTQAEVEKYKMDYTVLLGRDQNITADYKITKLPHLFIIDKKGSIRASERFLKADKIKTVLERLLKE
jgi:hypothetical protein